MADETLLLSSSLPLPLLLPLLLLLEAGVQTAVFKLCPPTSQTIIPILCKVKSCGEGVMLLCVELRCVWFVCVCSREMSILLAILSTIYSMRTHHRGNPHRRGCLSLPPHLSSIRRHNNRKKILRQKFEKLHCAISIHIIKRRDKTGIRFCHHRNCCCCVWGQLRGGTRKVPDTRLTG